MLHSAQGACMKKLFSLLFIFVVGGIGGIFFDRLALPYLAHTRLGVRFPALKRTGERTTIINKTEVVKIEETGAIPELAGRVQHAALAVEVTRRIKLGLRTVSSTTELTTGLALTSDGLLLLPLDESYVTSTMSLVDGDARVKLEVLSTNTTVGFMLLRAPGKQFTPLAFTDEEPKLGTRLFALSRERAAGEIVPSFQATMLSTFTSRFFKVSSALPRAAILVNFKGEVAGVSLHNRNGPDTIVPSSVLRNISEELLRNKL